MVGRGRAVLRLPRGAGPRLGVARYTTGTAAAEAFPPRARGTAGVPEDRRRATVAVLLGRDACRRAVRAAGAAAGAAGMSGAVRRGGSAWATVPPGVDGPPPMSRVPIARAPSSPTDATAIAATARRRHTVPGSAAPAAAA